MTTKKTFKMTFTFEVAINEEVEPNEIQDEIDGIKDYIFQHVRELEGHNCYATAIDFVQGE